MRPPVAISACLAGLNTRFDGGARPHELLQDLARQSVLIPLCPEIFGGLGIPRVRCRFVGGDGRTVLAGAAAVTDENNDDRTEAFIRGAYAALAAVRLAEPRIIIFKDGSPSCGVNRVDIDGQVSPGCGVTTALLQYRGYSVISETDRDALTKLFDIT
jgi:uncharacterized protein YbbK (DUF523 family)